MEWWIWLVIVWLSSSIFFALGAAWCAYFAQLKKAEEGLTKKEFVEGTLAATLRSARIGVARLELSDDGDTVEIIYNSGYNKTANISADSLAAIVMDVTRKAMY